MEQGYGDPPADDDSVESDALVTPRADFGGPGRYVARPDVPAGEDVLAIAPRGLDVALVLDDAARVVALLPTPRRAEIVSLRDTWRVELRRGRLQWELIASATPGGRPAGRARPSFGANSYRLQIGRRGDYVLSKRWLSGDWKVRGHRGRQAVVNIKTISPNVWCLDTAPGLPQGHLPLLVPLIVVTIQADNSIPSVGGGAGGG